jgi:hypothetical protein
MIDRNVRFTSSVMVRRIELCSRTPIEWMPVKCIPMRCTPVRYTPMRHTPMRYTPVRCSKEVLEKASRFPILQTVVRWPAYLFHANQTSVSAAAF